MLFHCSAKMDGLTNLSFSCLRPSDRKINSILHKKEYNDMLTLFWQAPEKISIKQRRAGWCLLNFHFLTSLLLYQGPPHAVTHHFVAEIIFAGSFFFSLISFSIFNALRSKADEGAGGWNARKNRSRTTYL